MLDGRKGGDPYVFYKLMHVRRAQQAWMLSEDVGLYEALRAGPASLDEICGRTGLERRPAAVLLSANACMGIVAIQGDRYSLHDVQRDFCLDGGRARNRPRIPSVGTDPGYDRLRQAFQTNRPVTEELPPWVASPQDGAEVQAFAPDRHGWRAIWGEALARAFDFTPFRHVVDLGGATGGVLVGLTEHYPNLKGTVVELPYSRQSAEAAIEFSGAAERVRFLSADFFTDPYPEDTDVLFMSHILHDWDDAHCLALLRRCHGALPAGSPVIAQEFLLNDDKTGPLLAVFQWFGLVPGTMGDQRTAREISALMHAAGFTDTESRPVDAEQSIVIGWKKD